MPVTGLYYISDLTPPPTTLLSDRLFKQHTPTPLGRFTIDHRLLRENPPPPPPTPSSSVPPSLPPPPPPPQPTPLPPSLPTTTTSSTTTTAGAGNNAHKFMQCLDLSYHPQKLFVLADRTLITLDREFELIVRGKMTQLWTHRQTLRAEGMGYEVGDFRVRIGNVLQAEQVKGVVVEIEYTPCKYLEQAEPIIRDFLQQLRPPQGRFTFAPREGYTPGQEWTLLDTGRQYCELLRLR
ncbi:hypothetical protein RUND412_005953 [Rhizina undulata]